MKRKPRAPLTDAQKAERQAAKSSNFRKLGEKRVATAIKKISYVRNLANRNSYAYTDEQAKKICDALAKAVTAVTEAFAGNASMEQSFTL